MRFGMLRSLSCSLQFDENPLTEFTELPVSKEFIEKDDSTFEPYKAPPTA